MKRFCRLLACCTGLFASNLCGVPASKPAIAADPALPAKENRLVIHEWGTFTCLQDELGKAVAGVNTDDEPVPEFVHRISDLIQRPSELAPVFYKGVPGLHRQVQMRLETPVVYFHLPADRGQPLRASLQVDFRGGWLTEYYPAATVNSPELGNGDFRFRGLTPQTRGSLEWHDLTIGGEHSLPETDAQVWLAPRDVDAATILAPGGEAEKYLFYRGVGNLPSPITISRTAANDGLIVSENLPDHLRSQAPLSIRALWLVHVRQDGQVSYRSLGPARLTGTPGRELLRTKLTLGDANSRDAERPVAVNPLRDQEELALGQYSGGNLARLRSEMREMLIADGLFQDEADAMLRTWELAYFKSPGLRLFYLLPQEWTNAVLPMKCSESAEISRTMVGRIEIVTPRQRALIQKIGAANVTGNDWFYQQTRDHSSRNEQMALLWEGKARFQDLKIDVPREYQDYLDLGRFRNALILEEFSRHPESEIRHFVDAYRLRYYAPD